MNGLIEVNDNDLISAHDLFSKLNKKGRFMDCWRSILTYGFEEDYDFLLVVKKIATNNPKNPHTKINDYMVTVDMAKEMLMLDKSDLGKKYRRYLIQRDKDLTKYLQYALSDEQALTTEYRDKFGDIDELQIQTTGTLYSTKGVGG